jgi:hypothetical protein
MKIEDVSGRRVLIKEDSLFSSSQDIVKIVASSEIPNAFRREFLNRVATQLSWARVKARGKDQHPGSFKLPWRTIRKSSGVVPRVLRLKEAPGYLGMDKNRFNTEVRPYITEIPVGKQGIGFDRLDLDDWLEEYKACNGRHGKQKGGKKPWQERKLPDSFKGMGYGTSTRSSEEEEFAKALERARSRKRKGI